MRASRGEIKIEEILR